jgi:uncharacterized protein YhfF
MMVVVLDGQGVPKAIVRTTELTKRRLDEVDEAFGCDEVKVIARSDTGAKNT